ncbi:MAG: DUF2341 domain-containing protein [Patescibacteria group bacterium]
MAERICRRVDGITITQKKNKNDYSVSQLSALNTDAHISRNISRSSMALACAVVRCGKCERMRRFYARGTATQVKTCYSAFGVVSKLRRNISSFTYKERRNRLTASVLTFVMLFQIVAGIFSPVNIFNLNKPMTANASWASDWGYRKEIKVDHTKVSPTNHTDQTNFPMLVSFTDPSLKSIANSGKVYNGAYLDIMFTEANGTTKLDWEKESYDPATGELVAWVKIPTLSAATDMSIYIYYGNSTLTASQENKTGVWDDGGANNFKMVQHLGGNVANGVAGHLDSTQYANNGTPNNFDGISTSTTNGTGQINGADVFDGANDYVDAGNKDLNISSAITLEAWVNISSKTNDTYPGIIHKARDNDLLPAGGGCATDFALALSWVEPRPDFFVTTSGGNPCQHIGGNAVLSLNTWYHMVGTYDANSGQAKIYLNGALDGSATLSGQILSSSSPLSLGRGSNSFNGTLDEVRISNTARSADWIATEYNNQSQPTEFSSLGIEEVSVPLSLSSFAYRKAITIDHTKVSGTTNLTNFPVLINLPTDASLSAHAQDATHGNGGDILFTSSTVAWNTGTVNDKLAHEIETYTASNGSLQAWVKVPTLYASNASQDTVIYMYYGNASAANQQNKTAVWDSNTKMVQHMNGSATPAVGDFKDSTQYANNSTNNTNEPTATAGQVDGAQSFDGTSSYVDAGNGSSLTINNTLTYEIWFKMNAFNGWAGPFSRDQNGYSLNIDDWYGGRYIAYLNNTAVCEYSQGASILNNWTKVSFVRDDNASPKNKLYVNGNLVTSSDSLTTFTSPTTNFLIGTSTGKYFNGSIDEVKVSDTARSAEWIATEYNNQSQPTEFSSLGIEEVSVPLSLSSFKYRKAITIDKTKVSGFLNNFPVLINLPTDDSLAANAQDDNDDILFTSSTVSWNTGTVNDKLAHEVESFNGATGSLQAWVKVPNISSANDTVIYMYYGNDSATSQQNKTAVWDGNTKMVQHMNQDPSGAPAQMKDSTQYRNNGTTAGSMTSGQLVVGQIGNGINFVGNNSQYIDVGNNSAFKSGNRRKCYYKYLDKIQWWFWDTVCTCKL